MSDIAAFHSLLQRSPRILAICGAGLSAASGLPTFRGAGGLWRNFEPTALATPHAFRRDPALVWLFYAWRRHMCLRAQPNAGHSALAALSRARGADFLCLTQNVDNLHERAGHPSETLRHLHGRLFDLRCSDCGAEEYTTTDPLCAALGPASADIPAGQPNPLLDPATPLAPIPPAELPHCACGGMQRPGVVWFGENLDAGMLNAVDRWIDERPVDIVLVIGTSSVVYPAAAYAERARTRNTRVVTVNLDPDAEAGRPGDMVFTGDAAEILPTLFEPLIGKESASANGTQ